MSWRRRILLVVCCICIVDFQCPSTAKQLANIPSLTIRSKDRCPVKRSLPDFNIDAYLGTWYNTWVRNPPPSFQRAGTTCVRAVYTSRLDGTVSVYNSATSPLGQFTEICGVARQYYPQTRPGDLRVDFPVSNKESPYQVLATDYYNYAVVYSCRNTPLGSNLAAWILTRSPMPSQQTVGEAFANARAHGLDPSRFRRIKHDYDCVYDAKPSCRTRRYPINAVGRVASVVRLWADSGWRLFAGNGDPADAKDVNAALGERRNG